MGPAAMHLFEAVVGALFALVGVATLGGWLRQAPAGSRWYAPRLVGTVNVALGVGLLMYGLLSGQPWSVLISMAAFVLAVICGITWVVKAARRDEFDAG